MERRTPRQAYAVARAKQQASIHTKIRGAGRSSRLEREAYRAAGGGALSRRGGSEHRPPRRGRYKEEEELICGAAALGVIHPLRKLSVQIDARGEPAPSGGGDGACQGAWRQALARRAAMLAPERGRARGCPHPRGVRGHREASQRAECRAEGRRRG